MTQLDVRLLGGFQARLGAGPPLALPAKTQALLAYLALRPGAGHPRDKIAALLWGATSDAQARANLRHTVFTLRKALDGSVLETDGHTIGLAPDAVDVDTSSFEQLVADGTPGALERAGDLYRGDLLEGLVLAEPAFEEWLLAERERLRELAVEALTKLLAHRMREPETERAIQTAMRLLALEPLQEAVHRTLMRLYGRQGRRAAALKQYQTCVSVLQRELGAEPEKETRDLYQEMLRHRPAEVERTSPRPGRIRPDRGTNRVAGSASEHRVDIDLPAATPLVGRDAELSRLRAALDGALDGRGQVVILVGEAGIGKTSILQTLASEAAGRGCRLAPGRSHETEQILPFGPWVDAFRAGQIVVDEEILGALAPVWRAELVRLFPELAAPGLPPSSEDQRRLFESMARLVEQAAVIQPLVVLLEDVHWADEMSVRLLSFLGRRLPAWPVLVMATAREEELADAAALRRALQELVGESYVTEVRLAPLSAPDTASLVRSLTKAGSDPEAVMGLEDQIWRVSEGNPFVVVETLRALGEGTALASTSLPLPDRVRAVIASRLEKLSDLGRQLTAAAAVIGREFDFPLLALGARLADSDAAAGVEELVRRRVLHGVGEGFEFTHDRIREVAYGQILPPRRKLLHREVGSALETLFAADLERHCAAIGSHYREGEVWERAVTYLRRAGAQAAGRSAYRDAAVLFDQALGALARLPESAATMTLAVDLRFDLRNALLPLREDVRIRVCLRDAEAIAERLADEERLGRVYTYLTRNLWGSRAAPGSHLCGRACTGGRRTPRGCGAPRHDAVLPRDRMSQRRRSAASDRSARLRR
jgi:DNA-binding SARP family transcriptional activator